MFKPSTYTTMGQIQTSEKILKERLNDPFFEAVQGLRESVLSDLRNLHSLTNTAMDSRGKGLNEILLLMGELTMAVTEARETKNPYLLEREEGFVRERIGQLMGEES